MNNNIERKKEFSNLKLKANYTKYVLYLIISLIIILLIVYSNYINNNSFVVDFSIIIIACYALYVVIIYTYEKFLNI